MLALDCLVQCAVPSPSRTETAKPVTTKQPNIENTGSRQKAQPTVKTTKKSAPKKPATPAPVNEFALNDILFKGRQSSKETCSSLLFQYSFSYLLFQLLLCKFASELPVATGSGRVYELRF